MAICTKEFCELAYRLTNWLQNLLKCSQYGLNDNVYNTCISSPHPHASWLEEAEIDLARSLHCYSQGWKKPFLVERRGGLKWGGKNQACEDTPLLAVSRVGRRAIRL